LQQRQLNAAPNAALHDFFHPIRIANVTSENLKITFNISTTMLQAIIHKEYLLNASSAKLSVKIIMDFVYSTKPIATNCNKYFMAFF